MNIHNFKSYLKLQKTVILSLKITDIRNFKQKLQVKKPNSVKIQGVEVLNITVASYQSPKLSQLK